MESELQKRNPIKLRSVAAAADHPPTRPNTWREIMFFVLKIGALVVAMTAVTWAAAQFAYLWYR